MSNTPVVIRAAKPSDLKSMVDITNCEFRPFSIDAAIEDLLGGVSWLEIKKDALMRECQQNPCGCFVAVAGDEVAGYVTTTINATASRGVIANLAVSSKFQGGGIGRRLLGEALAYFRRIGLKQAKIETLEINEVGRHLYPSLGFKEVSRQIHYAMPL